MIPCPKDNDYCKDNGGGGGGGLLGYIGLTGGTEFGPDSDGSYWVSSLGNQSNATSTYLSYTGFNKSTMHNNLWSVSTLYRMLSAREQESKREGAKERRRA